MSQAPVVTEQSAAALIARFLKARGVDRVFALCGGHIMPLWMRLDAEGIRIVDVRDERAAVYMAHAHAEVTGGLGVALVTAGPGVTNAMTGHRQCARRQGAGAGPVGHAAAAAGESRRAAGHDPHRLRPAADPLCAHRARARAGAAGTRRGGLARLRPGRRAGSGLPRLSGRHAARRGAARARACPSSFSADGRATGSARPAAVQRAVDLLLARAGRCSSPAAARAAPVRRWSNCSSGSAPSTSTPAKAAAWCREDHPRRWSRRCAAR